jgi:uncharacterized YccA/Bax inhibitor family protein
LHCFCNENTELIKLTSTKQIYQMASNPFMNDDRFTKESSLSMSQEGRMTQAGAVNKTITLVGIMLLTAAISVAIPNALFASVGAIGGLICAIWAGFQPHNSKFLAPAYAAFEGLFIGTISLMYAMAFHGIVFQAITLTLAILFFLLMVFKYRLIKVTSGFRTGVMAATAGIAMLYLISFGLSFFGISVPYIHEGGMIGIGFSLFVVGLASMNLLLDFDTFEKGEQHGAPAYMEWYAAMGLLITLVWLYVEVLRLLAKLSSRD